MTEEKIPKLVVFDLDGTLAESKSVMDNRMSELLRELLTITKVSVISGGSFAQFEKQFLVGLSAPKDLLNGLFLFPTCGARFFRFEDGWKEVYAHVLTTDEKRTISEAFTYAFSAAGFVEPKEIYGELIEDRGTQVTFSAYGQLAPVELKKSWDPDQKKRLHIKKFLDEKLPHLEVRIGGATSIDVTRKGIDKAHGVREMEKHLGTAISDMVFIGDALFPGGNDHAALSTGIKGIQTSGPEETKLIIESILSSR